MSKIKHFIESQLPDHLKSESEQLIAFLEAYYEWLEQTNGPLPDLRSAEKRIDIDQTLNEFGKKILNELSENFPETTNLSREKIVKQLRNLYASKGTEQSFKLLFRMLFSDDVQFKYPGREVLAPSAGRWTIDQSVRVERIESDGPLLFQGSPFDLVQKVVVFVDEFGVAQGEAVVDRVSFYYQGSFPIYELFFSKGTISGEIQADWLLYEKDAALLDQTKTRTRILGTTVGAEIVSASGIFREGTIVPVTAGGGVGSKIRIVTVDSQSGLATNILVSKFGIGYTTDFTETFVLDDEFDAPVATFNTYADIVITDLQNNDRILVLFDENNDNQAAYYRFVIDESSLTFDFETNTYLVSNISQNLLFDGLQTRLVVNFTVGGLGQYPGYFRTNDGKISDIVRIQDAQRYQKFAYVIQTGISINRWRNIVKEILHPAGFAFFGELTFKTEASFLSTLQVEQLKEFVNYPRDYVDLMDDADKDIDKPRSDTFALTDDADKDFDKPRADTQSLSDDADKDFDKPRSDSLSTPTDDADKDTTKERADSQVIVDDADKDFDKPRSDSLSTPTDDADKDFDKPRADTQSLSDDADKDTTKVRSDTVTQDDGIFEFSLDRTIDNPIGESTFFSENYTVNNADFVADQEDGVYIVEQIQIEKNGIVVY